jgi:hypothetical protein
MAYITQEMKKELAPAIKSVLKKFGVKGTISINHNTSLNVNIKEGVLDFIGEANQRNKEYSERNGSHFHVVGGYYQENAYRGRTTDEPTAIDNFLEEIRDAMRGTLYYNNDDIMTDYFDSAYFMGINIGKYNKPYKLTETS